MKIIIVNKSDKRLPDNIVSRTDNYMGMRWNKILYSIDTNKDIEVRVLLEEGDKDRVVIN